MFITNEPKDLLREQYDAKIIRDKFFNVDDEIVYFGMPGPAMLDVKVWRDFLDFIIAIEHKKELIGIMEITAKSIGVNNKIQILQGKIENIILNWEDDEGEIPSREFFNVVNLDFESGFLGFTDKFLFDKRTEAIRELFRFQKKKKDSLDIVTLQIIRMNFHHQFCNNFNFLHPSKYPKTTYQRFLNNNPGN